MDTEQPTTVPSNTPQTTVPPASVQTPAPTPAPVPQPPLAGIATPPPTQAKAKQMNTLYIVIGAVLCVAILVFGFLYARSTTPTSNTPTVAVTPTEAPTPTPPPNVSRIATTSAFLTFKEEIASFSATLNAFSLQDSTLAPPIMDLELNLTN